MSEQQNIISEQQVAYVAKLAHLRFDQEELADYTEKLASVLGYMQELSRIDTTGVELTTHVLPLTNVFREDEPGEQLPHEKALANAPDSMDGSFRVPSIL